MRRRWPCAGKDSSAALVFRGWGSRRGLSLDSLQIILNKLHSSVYTTRRPGGVEWRGGSFSAALFFNHYSGKALPGLPGKHCIRLGVCVCVCVGILLCVCVCE